MKRIAYPGAFITVICLADMAFAPAPASAQVQVETRVPAVTTSAAPAASPAEPALLAQTAGVPAANPPADSATPETTTVSPAVAQQAGRAGGALGTYSANAWGAPPGAIGSIAYGSTLRGEHALVVRSSEADAKTIAAAEEDLNVMGLILEKALYQSGDEEQREAMGIRLLTAASGSPARRSLEIEGYGAIFLLNVNFPLAGPAEKSDEDKKEPSNSTWDEAKRELYGQSEGNQDMVRFSKEEYDPKRVEKLKDSLLEALKNAANIRSLKSDESVTVVVTSHTGSGRARLFQKKAAATGGFSGSGRLGGGGSGGGGFGGGNMPLWQWQDGNINAEGGGESVLTIRTRKSDIDLFAKGKLTLEDFRKKANVLIY